ncbi:MAG: hypothetical protein FJW61_07520, partial [Actinobacteria bacterium]|nr:hypothetical protein [Actinomycetota bacterium]
MAGLAGIIYRKNPQNEYKYNYKQTVNEILKKISHRGRTNKKILEIKNKKLAGGFVLRNKEAF